jgi:F0F1-type ATP synthase membrane subunit b/b'
MESVLASVSELLLRAVPTFLILLFLHFYLKAMFYKPLDKALKERKAATAGVRKLAEESLSKAEQKSIEYELAIRAARSQLYKEQEEARNKLRRDQAAAVAQLRQKTEAMVAEAKQRLQVEKEAAKSSLESESESLANEIVTVALAGGAR